MDIGSSYSGNQEKPQGEGDLKSGISGHAVSPSVLHLEVSFVSPACFSWFSGDLNPLPWAPREYLQRSFLWRQSTLFFYFTFLYGRARGLKNQGDFDTIGEESLFPKCEQLCLFSLIASLKASQTEWWLTRVEQGSCWAECWNYCGIRGNWEEWALVANSEPGPLRNHLNTYSVSYTFQNKLWGSQMWTLIRSYPNTWLSHNHWVVELEFEFGPVDPRALFHPSADTTWAHGKPTVGAS